MKTAEQKAKDKAYFRQQDMEVNLEGLESDMIQTIIMFLFVIGLVGFFGLMMSR